jgi:general secretion pathway protein F
MASFQELQALNAEIAALARAGVPLELGLSQLARTLPRRLGGLSGRIAARLQEGHSLVEALRQEGRGVSPIYVAVVEAALTVNRLPEALDALVAHAVAVRDLRRRLALAMIYPGIVAVVAYVFFLLFLLQVPLTVLEVLDFAPQRLDEGTRQVRAVLSAISQSATLWGPLVPAGLVLLLAFVARMACVASGFRTDAGHGLLSGMWIPGVARVYADLDHCQAAALLQVLLEHHVPLPRALRLSAASTASQSLRQSFEQLAGAIEEGRPLKVALERAPRLPTLIRRVFTLEHVEAGLPSALRQVTTIFRRRALRQIDWLRAVFAPAFLAVVGGGATLMYALALFLPLRSLWENL